MNNSPVREREVPRAGVGGGAQLGGERGLGRGLSQLLLLRGERGGGVTGGHCAPCLLDLADGISVQDLQ